MANPKKPITIDELAQMVERGFAETSSKKDTWLFREEVEQQFKVVIEDVALLRRDTEAGLSGIAATLKAIQGEIKELRAMDAEMTALRLRVERLERKVGISD